MPVLQSRANLPKASPLVKITNKFNTVDLLLNMVSTAQTNKKVLNASICQIQIKITWHITNKYLSKNMLVLDIPLR